ncbi:hypothetical protein FKP32DRAFT_256134 [Trametes sanguinea]|nr:hypothetical protein FKP32DRAFT_256134 [Trametes sanguinea]
MARRQVRGLGIPRRCCCVCRRADVRAYRALRRDITYEYVGRSCTLGHNPNQTSNTPVYSPVGIFGPCQQEQGGTESFRAVLPGCYRRADWWPAIRTRDLLSCQAWTHRSQLGIAQQISNAPALGRTTSFNSRPAFAGDHVALTCGIPPSATVFPMSIAE